MTRPAARPPSPGASATAAGTPPPRPGFGETGLLLLTVACISLSVTYRIFETDFWQHLAVGRAIWTTGAIPTAQLWSWPTYGAVDTTSSYSWLFRFLVYPVWSLGGVPGLFLWRWLTTLAVFGLLWKTARVLGARGPWLYLVLVVCAFIYRQRTQVRPETLAAVFFAVMLLLLEQRRAGARDRSLWLIPLAWLWANTHVTYYLGLILIAIHALAEGPPRSRAALSRPGRHPLGAVWVGAAAATFINPYGWRAVWQPIQYLLVQRQEDIYRSIGEIRLFDWRWNLWNGSPFLLVLWPLLQLWRARRGAPDLVESWSCVLFTAQALLSGRFIGYWALVAAPYLARDLRDWLAARAWPRWRMRAAWGLAVAGVIVSFFGELARPDMPFGVGLVPGSFPQHACDFIATHGIRGRAFNSFEYGGYMLWRFWPDRTRLPFMDIHQAGTPHERFMYVYAHARRDGWAALNQRYQPDFVLARRLRVPGDSLKDFADADPAWALLFADDAAALYVRRTSVPPGLPERLEYSIIPGGNAGLTAIQAGMSDPTFRARLRPELDRMIAASPLNSIASSFRATFHLVEGRLDEAEADLERAHHVDPLVPDYAQRRGTIALLRGDLGDALTWYRRQRRATPAPEVDLGVARIYQRLGKRREAVRIYRRLLRSPAQAVEARDSLRSLGSGT